MSVGRGALDRYLGLCARRPGLLVCAGALVAMLSLCFALRLQLRTDMAELLPRDHPSVAALHTLAEHERLGASLIVLIESPDREANLRCLAALRPRLEELRPSLFAEIDWGPDPTVAAWMQRWKWLYADLASIERAEELLDRVLLEKASPLAVSIDDEDPKEELRRLQRRLDGALPAPPKSQYFEGASDGLHRVGVLLWRRRQGLASSGDHAALAAVRTAIAGVRPTQLHPALRVLVTGHVAQAIEEQDSIREDLTIATTACTALILVVLYLYVRRLAAVLVVGVPACVGLFVALAIASLSLGALNLNTAFLISIILGNGINFPIVLLARFGEERARCNSLAAAVGAAVHGSLRGTLGAMGAASIAYGSLLATRFRGFNQFGWLGGLGMLLVWTFTILLIPPLIHLGERLRPGLLTPRPNLWRRPFAWLGSRVAHMPRVFLVGALTLGVAAAFPIWHLAKSPVEWDLRQLRPADTPARELWQRAEALGINNPDTGYVGSHGALLVDEPGQADAVAEALRVQDQALGDPVFKRIRTWASLLPTEQPRKLAALARIRRKIDRRLTTLGDEERRQALRWRPPDDLRPVRADELPSIARRAFTERDGTIGRLVLMSVDRATYSDWNGRDLLRLSRHLRVEALGRTWVAASPATVFAGMIETLLDDGPRVALVALVGVVLFLVFVLGGVRAVPALISQALGILWFGGVLGALGLHINFFNFVGLPITFGVGADYAANILARLQKSPRASLAEVIAGTGSAVALCSLTTIIGYSSLLVARNPALRSFGIMADVGEVCCLVAALVCLPALWAGQRGNDSSSPGTSTRTTEIGAPGQIGSSSIA